MINVITAILNIFAILTAFFGIYLVFQEAIKGVILNILTRFMDKDRINGKMLTVGVAIFIILLLWAWVLTHFPILLLQQIAAPVYGIVSCLIPCYLVYRVPALHKYKGLSIYYIIIIGLMLCASPFFKFFE